jgi:hypothetical protein
MKRSRLLALIMTALACGLAGSAGAASDGPFVFYSVTPCRLVDTRDTPVAPDKGPALVHNAVRSFPIYGPLARNCGIPGSARAVTVNATIIDPDAGGHITLFPYNTAMPSTATINFNSHEPALANGQVVGLTVDTYYQLSVYAGVGAGGEVDLTLDITGYYKAP